MWCQRWQRQRPRNGCFFSFPLRKKEEMRFDDLCNKCLSRKVSWPLKVLASFLRTKKPPAKSRFGTHPSIGGSLGTQNSRSHSTRWFDPSRWNQAWRRGQQFVLVDAGKIWVKQFDQQQVFFFEIKLYHTLNLSIYRSWMVLVSLFFFSFFSKFHVTMQAGTSHQQWLLDMKILVTCDWAHRHAADFCLMMVAICENGSWSFGTTLKTIAPNCIQAVFFETTTHF